MSTRHVHHGITNHDPRKPLQNPPRRIDRRTLLKATAAFIAMATAAPAAAPRLAEAEDGNTRAADWNQPENIGGEGDYLSFDTEFSFNALAPHWPGDTPFPAAVEISLSSDGQTWSEWTLVGPAHTDAGPPDRDGRIFGELVFSEEASMVRYRGLDADGNVIAIPGLSFTYINAKAGPRISDF